MTIGKKIRLERIIDKKSRNMLIIPMDHGVTVGPIEGLEDMAKTVDKVAEGGADAVILHKGIVNVGFREYGKNIGLIIHLSASTILSPDSNNKVLVTTVEQAIAMGADGVSAHINIGDKNESEMLKILGSLNEICEKWGLPLIAMMYPRGEKVDSEHNVKWVKLAARVGAELGADIIKTNYTGDIDSFREVVKGCPVPIIIAGGPKMESDKEILQMTFEAMRAGARGVSIGRNVFQHENPVKIVRALAKIVHEKKSVEEAIQELK